MNTVVKVTDLEYQTELYVVLDKVLCLAKVKNNGYAISLITAPSTALISKEDGDKILELLGYKD